MTLDHFSTLRAAAARTLLALCAAAASAGPAGAASLADVLRAVVQASRASAPADAASHAGAPGTPPFELAGVLTRAPITNTQRPETWPRVAVTISSATPGVFKLVGLGDHNSLGPADCIVYNVKVWSSPTESQVYDGLRLCSGELYRQVKDVPMFQVPTWGRRQYFVGEKTTGALRTDGPTPPADHFPTDPALQVVWLDNLRNTIFYVGAILRQVGFDWNNIYDKRVWFVSVPPRS